MSSPRRTVAVVVAVTTILAGGFVGGEILASNTTPTQLDSPSNDTTSTNASASSPAPHRNTTTHPVPTLLSQRATDHIADRATHPEPTVTFLDVTPDSVTAGNPVTIRVAATTNNGAADRQSLVVGLPTLTDRENPADAITVTDHNFGPAGTVAIIEPGSQARSNYGTTQTETRYPYIEGTTPDTTTTDSLYIEVTVSPQTAGVFRAYAKSKTADNTWQITSWSPHNDTAATTDHQGEAVHQAHALVAGQLTPGVHIPSSPPTDTDTPSPTRDTTTSDDTSSQSPATPTGSTPPDSSPPDFTSTPAASASNPGTDATADDADAPARQDSPQTLAASAVEFRGCDTVHITDPDNVSSVELGTVVYVSDGIDTQVISTQVTEPTDLPQPGTVDEGLNGYYVSYVLLMDDDGERIATAGQPDEEACAAQIQPDRPTVSFTNATETTSGDLEATFTYENPNDDPLYVGTRIIEGSVGNEYPTSSFQPGTNNFTVTWQPETLDENLLLDVDLRGFGWSNASIQVDTPPAAEFTDNTGAGTPQDTTTDDTDTPSTEESTPTSSDGDVDDADASAEFIDCDSVRIDGDDVAEVEMGGVMYASDGVDTQLLTFTVDDTPITIPDDVPAEFSEGTNGSYVSSVTLFDDDGEKIELTTNPDADRCDDLIRPHHPTVEFVGATETNTTDDLEATFEYENPNDEALFLGTEVTNGTVDDRYPINGYEPGTHTVSVTWQPESESETLELTVDLSGFGWEDDTIRIDTPPASQFRESNTSTSTS